MVKWSLVKWLLQNEELSWILSTLEKSCSPALGDRDRGILGPEASCLATWVNSGFSERFRFSTWRVLREAGLHQPWASTPMCVHKLLTPAQHRSSRAGGSGAGL